jgi:hypothetical protein
MGLKQVLKAVKALQQTYEVKFPDTDGNFFTGTFRVLVGKDIAWTFDYPYKESYSKVEIRQQLLRQFICSLQFFTEENGDVIWPWEFITLMVPDFDPKTFTYGSTVEEAAQVGFSEFWRQLSKTENYKTFDELPYLVKIFLWDTLLVAMMASFEPEYLDILTDRYLETTKQINATPMERQLRKTLEEIESRHKIESSLKEAESKLEAPAQD